MTHAGLLTVGSRWRVLAALVAVVLALVPLGAAQAEDRLNMTVLSGDDNVDAALAWSQHAFPGTSTNAILGRSDLPPDNLASGLLQGALDAPLLLNPSTTLDPAVKAELERLEARTVHILGGLTAISSGVEAALRAEGYAIRRYAGATRIETAQEIAASYGGAATTALLARAFGVAADPTSAWADALAGGAWAADDEVPVLFTQTETLTASTRKYLEGSRVRTINILGGTAAINDSVKAQLEAMGIAVKRVSGATRFATATAIAAERGYTDVTKATSVVLADGQHTDGWAAGFTAAGFAADKPIVLSNGAALPAETNTFLTGGTASQKLIVAPYVTDAAATAAADKMGLAKAATVTLDATSFSNNGNITGKITPLTDVKSSAIAGACVTAGALSPNASTGAFSVPVTQNFAPGSCEVTITVTYDNDATTTHPFTITITGPPPTPAVTDGPELTAVSVSNQTADYVVLKYTFDEAVTLVPTTGAAGFDLQGFNADTFEADVDPDFAPAVREDPADTTAILASFAKEDYLSATTATVAAGSVADRSATPINNPEGSRDLQAVSFVAGATVLPDLVGVSNLVTFDQDTTTGTDYVVRATFTFDVATWLASTATAADYQLMTKAGVWRSGLELVSGDGTTTHVVEFGDGVTATSTFGSGTAGQEAADTFRTSVRRALVDAGAVEDEWEQGNMELTVSTGSSTDLDIPNLLTVTAVPDTDPATDKVRYTFAATVVVSDQTKFFVYSHDGGPVVNSTAATLDAEDNKSVLATFAGGAIDGQVTGGGTEAADAGTPAVTDGTDDGEYQTRPATSGAHTYATGTTLAPELLRVIRKANSEDDPFGGSTVTAYTVTFRFDTAVDAVTAGDDSSFKMYAVDGDVNAFATECAEGTSTATTMDIVCTVLDDDDALFTAVKNAVLFAVEAGAVTAEDHPTQAYGNYGTSKVPSAS